ncbi:MAG TPA: hypothetical protein VFH27_17440, partial [Longimicrobiaceae bacterium]|nr:hypothetical protein [Longimicrobiaceae bacterium]
GLYSVLFGMGFFLTRRRPGIMAASLASIGLGMTALYLSQVRSVLVMTLIAIVAVGAVLIWRRDVKRAFTLGGALFVMVVGGYVGATSLAGAAVAQRVGSLTASRPGSVYYQNRGHFLLDVFTQTLPEHPLGSGLGRWGMAGVYFPSAPKPDDPPAVWVEVQWAGWAVDGGIPLMVAYVAAILAGLWMAWRVARLPRSIAGEELPFWGAIVLAHGIGALALTFSYPLFVGQTGMEFWLLNATIFAAARPLLQARRAGWTPAP